MARAIKRIVGTQLWLVPTASGDKSVPNTSFIPTGSIDFLIELFFAPGNYVVSGAAALATGYFGVPSHKVMFALDSQLALWTSAAFWFVLGIEMLVLYRYSLAACSGIRLTYRRLRQRTEQRIRRYRIMQACQEAADAPTLAEDTTIVEEIGQLDMLAAMALRIARDESPADGVTAQFLSQALAASKNEIRTALEQLEQLQFLGREPGKKASRASYKLLPAGDLYLKVCEIRDLA